MLRVFVDAPLQHGQLLTLPPDAARHVQVLRLQPGEPLVLFNGQGGHWQAKVVAMGRRDVAVRLLAHDPVERELPGRIVLAVGMPANERFDWLVEKACELGAHALQPLVCERSVLRLSGERAERKAAHWQSVANAAAEQCGRNRPLQVAPPRPLADWLAEATSGARWVLSLQPQARPATALRSGGELTLLSGPEGGLSPREEALALARGFVPLSLGARVLRAETAPLACLAAVSLGAMPSSEESD